MSWIISFVLLLACCATIGYSDSEVSVVEMGLISSTATIGDILQHHAADCPSARHRHFQGATLGYVTPWNGEGYTIAKKYASKFTHVSPVWYQVRLSSNAEKFSATVTGGHDVDRAWVTDVKSGGSRIVPRFIIETDGNGAVLLAGNSKVREAVIRKIVSEVKASDLDGVTLEFTDAWAVVESTKPKLRKGVNAFVSALGKALHAMERRKELVLVVRPYAPGARHFGTDSKDVPAVDAHVDYYSLMTYDYSGGRPGPSAPLTWVREATSKLALQTTPGKVLVGLNFYGMDFGETVAPILGRDYLKLLDRKPAPHLKWHEEWAEHSLTYKDKKVQHTVFYPTLQSVQSRVSLATELGVGLSIWELGQGLEYFTQLL